MKKLNQHRIFIYLLLFALCKVNLSAQENLRFRKLSREDGLPSNKIYASVQDEQGYTWIATAGGLSRYDSYEIKTYRADDGSGLKSNQIKCLYNDSKGYLWIGTDGGGLTRYDYRTDLFKTFLHEANNPKSLLQNQILALLEDSKGNLWIGTEAGISIFDYTTETFSSHVHKSSDPYSISSGGILSILEDRAGRIWVGTWNGGLNLLLPKASGIDEEIRFLHIKHEEENPYSLSHNAVWSMKEDEQGRLWIGTFGGGLNLMIPPKEGDYYADPRAFRFVAIRAKFNASQSNLRSDKIYAIEQRNQILWIGTTNGLSLFHLSAIDDSTLTLRQLQDQFDAASFTNYVREYNPRYGLNGNQIVHIYKDQQDMMWVSTEEGLALNPKDRQRIPLYLDAFAQKRGFIVMDFLRDHEGSLWVANSDKGLSRYNEKNDQLDVVYKFKKDGSLLPPFKKLFQTKDKTIWLGTFLGLFYLDAKTGKIQRFTSPKITYVFSVEDFAEDQDGNLWIATDSNGLIVIDTKKEAKIYKHKENDSLSISSDNVTSIEITPSGQVWISTDGGGFNKAIKQTDGNYHFQSFLGQNHPDDPPANLINDIKAIGDDLWIGAHNKLFKYSPSKDSCYYYEVLEESVTSIHALESDADENIWIASNDGIFRYHESSNRLSQFQPSDGTINDYIIGASYKDDSGKIFFGAALGFHAFYGEQIELDNYVRTPKIRNLRLHNRIINVGEPDSLLSHPILEKHISETNRIQLSCKHDMLGFDYAVLNYDKRQTYEYEHRLLGLSSNWTEGGRENRVYYTNLASGSYVFEIRVKNSDGYWSKVRRLQIEVLPPFWLTTWFIALASLLLTGLVILAIRIYDRQSTRTRILLEKKIEKRTQEVELARQEAEKANEAKSIFLANMSHEIRTPMNSMLGTMELLDSTELNQEQSTFLETIRQSGDNLLYIINDILDFTKIEARKLELENTSFNLRTAIEDILLLFAPRAYSKSIALNYALEYDVPSSIRCDQKKLRQILTNLIDNALKFTETGSIFLTVKTTATAQIQFQLADTGVGIPASKIASLFDAFTQVDASATRKFSGSGLGLAICKGLCEAMGGHIQVESELGKGTTFAFNLPLHKGVQAGTPTFPTSIDSSKSVLILDQSAANLASIESMLKQLNLDWESIHPIEAEPIVLESPFRYCIYNASMPKKILEKVHQLKAMYPDSSFIALLPLGANTLRQKQDDQVLTTPLQYHKLINIFAQQSKENIEIKQTTIPKQAVDSTPDTPLEILVAEDNVFNQRLILAVLARFGYHAKLAENGLDAVSMVEEENFDLIFMDVQMPQMDGLEATRKIRALTTPKQPTIIGLTANALDQDRKKCLDAGMDDHIGKPFNIQKIDDVLKSMTQKELSS